MSSSWSSSVDDRRIFFSATCCGESHSTIKGRENPAKGCSMTTPPFIDLAFAPARVDTRPSDDGGLILSSPMPLEPPPDRSFLAERDRDGSW